MQVVVSPFAPHGLGDQMWPVDQNVTLCCQGAPIWEVPVDAEQTGRVKMPRLREPQHLVDRKCFFRSCHLRGLLLAIEGPRMRQGHHRDREFARRRNLRWSRWGP
jgi:hypothetical protein